MTMLWKCNHCSTRFAVGTRMCPQCTGTSVSPVEGDDDMGKVSKAQGPSVAGQPKPAGSSGPLDNVGLPPGGDEEGHDEQTPDANPEDAGDGDEQDQDSEDAGEGDDGGEPVEPTSAYEDLTKKQLIAEAKNRDLAWYGNRQDIIERLVDHDEGADDDDLEVSEDD